MNGLSKKETRYKKKNETGQEIQKTQNKTSKDENYK